MLVSAYRTARRARDLAERLLGLGALRIAESAVDTPEMDRDLAVGCPNSVEGFLVAHADVAPARVFAARARVQAETRLSGLRAARELGLFPETTFRLMAIKLTPESEGKWIAAGMDARAQGDFTALNADLREAHRPPAASTALGGQALAPVPAPPLGAPDTPVEPAPPDAPVGTVSTVNSQLSTGSGSFPADTPDTVRARRVQRETDRREGRPPSTVRRLDLKLALDAEQLDSWTQAMRSARGESRDTPTPSQVLVTILEHFGAGFETPATRADIRPGRRYSVDPVTGRWHLKTHTADMETAPLAPASSETGGQALAPVPAPPLGAQDTPRVREVLVRRARGKHAAPTREFLTREFPELIGDPDSPECRRRVRALLGYPEDRAAVNPEPPVPARLNETPAPVLEDQSPVVVVEAVDPRADAWPELPAPDIRAVTAAAGRADAALRWHELQALAALDAAERAGTVTPGTTRAACEREFVFERSRQEALWLWRALDARPALTGAMKAGLDYSKVRALASVEPEALDPWIAFAWRHTAHVLEAHLRVRTPNRPPPVTPTGMAPVLPLRTRLTEALHLDLSPAQQQTLAALRRAIERLHGGPVTDAVFYGDLAGWYVRRRTTKKRGALDVVVHQREPETRVPIELRAPGWDRARLAGALAGARRRALHALVAAHLPWLVVPGSSVRGEWREPTQTPGQAYVPVACEDAVMDRDGPRCSTPRCPHDLVPTYNHGTWRRVGGVADPDTDQMQCLPCNNDHSNEALVAVNRPDGGVWCWDGRGRRHGTVAPVARHLDRALITRLLTLAEQQLMPTDRPAQRFAPSPTGTGPPETG